MPIVLAITGPKRSGKTTLCARLVQRCTDLGLCVGGVLAPDRIKEGAKAGIDVVWLRDGQRHALARIVPRDKATTVGEYAFDQQVLDDTLAVLLRDLSASLDLVVIDEIGRLELKQGGGYAAALDAIASSPVPVVAVTVRPELVEILSERIAPSPVHAFDITDDPERALTALVEAIRGATQMR
ncbi:MAG: nucleoside-triphosphatase [Anaerolineae bacterium]